MGIFKRSIKLQDPYLLQFTKNDSRCLKEDHTVLSILEGLDGHERSSKSSAVKILPLMTFSVACLLFQQLRTVVMSKDQPFEFETIDILQRQASGKYKPYEHINGFKIDRSYRDFSGAIIENLFKSSDYAEVDYDNKREWAGNLIEAYQTANPNQKIIALLPSEDEADELDYHVKYAGLDEVVASPEKMRSQPEKSSILPTTVHEDETLITPVVASHPTTTENKAKSKTVANQDKASERKQVRSVTPEKKQQTSKPQTAVRTQQTLPLAAHIIVPKFEVKHVQEVPEHDEHYVAYQVDVKKIHTNEYLTSLEKRLNASSAKALTAFKQQQSQVIDQAISEFKTKNNPQKGLSEEIQTTISTKKTNETKQTLKALKQRRDNDIQHIQKDADRAIEERKTEYLHQVDEEKDKLTAKYVKQANELQQKWLKQRKTVFKTALKKQQDSLEREARAKFNERVAEITAESENVAGTVYQNLAKIIDGEYTVSMTKAHLNALEVQASANRARFNLNDMEALEQKNTQLSEAKQKLEHSKTELQRLLDSQTSEINQLKSTQTPPASASSSSLEKVLAMQIAQNQAQTATQANPSTSAIATNASQPGHKWSAKLMSTVAGILGVVIIGGGAWFHQDQQMTQALTANQQQLSKAKSTTESLSQKYYQLDTTNQSLKNQASSQSERLKQAEKEASSAKDKNQQTEAKLIQAQATATSQASKTSKK